MFLKTILFVLFCTILSYNSSTYASEFYGDPMGESCEDEIAPTHVPPAEPESGKDDEKVNKD